MTTTTLSEDKRSDHKLDGLQLALRALFDSAAVMMHSIDDEGRIIDVNSRWLEIMGYRREEVVGKRSVSFLTEESRARAINDTLPLFWEVGSARSVSHQFVTKENAIIDTLLDAEVVPGALGTPVTIAVIRVAPDIVEWRYARSLLAAIKSLLMTWWQLGSETSSLETSIALQAPDPRPFAWRADYLRSPLAERLNAAPLVLNGVAVLDDAPRDSRTGRSGAAPAITLRELDVLRLVATGATNKEIAGWLSIGESTAKTHVEHLFEKLNVHDRTDAAMEAVRRGIIRPTGV